MIRGTSRCAWVRLHGVALTTLGRFRPKASESGICRFPSVDDRYQMDTTRYWSGLTELVVAVAGLEFCVL
eukprot:1445031-Rhodomonas_salina.3